MPEASDLMRILIADDHALILDMISMFLSSESEFEIETSEDISGCLEKLNDGVNYDLALLDYNMPGMNGLDGLAQVIAANNSNPVAIMSGEASRDVVQSAIDAGAAGFIPKSLPAKSLINAVKFMASGEQFIPVSFMNQKLEAKEQHPLEKTLSERELQVLEGLCRGLTNKEIARELDLQEVTIKLHVKTLCRKLDARNRTQAAMFAKEMALF